MSRAVTNEPRTFRGNRATDRVGRGGSSVLDSFQPHVVAERPTAAALTAKFREHLAGALYAGDLYPGDRLPSIREFAEYVAVNRKTAERVYRVLEADGMVELRPRSGVYLSRGVLTEESQNAPPEWIARLITDAADTPEGLVALPDLIRRYVGGREISCACVDGTEDLRVGLTGELRRRFGLRVYPLRGGPFVDPAEKARLARDLADVDIVVTTPYHAALARIARELGKPTAIAVPDPSFVEALRVRLDAGALDLLCVDREFGSRLLNLLPLSLRDRLRVVTVDDEGGLREIDRSLPIFVTEAARIALAGDRARDIDLHPRYLGARSSGAIGRLIARLNAAGAPPPAHS